MSISAVLSAPLGIAPAIATSGIYVSTHNSGRLHQLSTNALHASDQYQSLSVRARSVEIGNAAASLKLGLLLNRQA